MNELSGMFPESARLRLCYAEAMAQPSTIAVDRGKREAAGSGASIILWHIALADARIADPACQAALTAMLSEPERQRSQRFHFSRHQHRYIAAHVAMRYLLAAHCGVPASTITLTESVSGKPELLEGRPFFNLAHSGDHALLAICDTAPVGVDCEVLRSVPDCIAVATRFFAAEEQRCLAALPLPERELQFFRIWTAKEALLKGTGDGLRLPLRSFAMEGAVPSEGFTAGMPRDVLHLGRVDESALQLMGWNLVLDSSIGALQVAVASTLRNPSIQQQSLDWRCLLAALPAR